jgi:5-methylcytosine-specific restriction protein A
MRPCPRHPERPPQDSPSARGYGGDWAKASAAFLVGKVCIVCKGPAEVTDHVKPHKGDPDLFWDRSNWAPMCRRCHGKKTARQDGSFGNPRKSVA